MLTTRFGIMGAAIAWTLRATLEATALFSLSQRFLARRLAVVRFFAISVIAALLVFYFATLVTGLTHRFIFLACTLAMFASGSWLLVLRPEERAFLIETGRHRLSRVNELA
jgi:hypothetical protein